MWATILFDARVRQAVASLVAVALGARLYLTGWPGLGDLIHRRADPSVYLLIAMLAAGFLVPPFGRRALPNQPRRALMLLEVSTLAVLAAVALLTALSLWVAVHLSPAATDPADQQEAGKTVTAAVAAILTALVASVSRSEALSWAGKAARSAFQDCYRAANFPDKPDIPPLAQSDEPVELEGETGWGWEARQARARLIEEKLNKT